MNFGEPKHELGSLEAMLVELNLPTDPRRLLGRWYKFTTQSTENKNGVFIGTIVGVRFDWPHEIDFSVSDTSIRRIFAYRAALSGKMLWRLVSISRMKIECWLGEFKLL